MLIETAFKVIGNGRVSTLYSDGNYAYKTYPNNYPESYILHEVKTMQVIKNHTNIVLPEAIFDEPNKTIQMTLIEGITLAHRMRVEKYKNGLEDLMTLQLSLYQYKDLDIDNAYQSYERIIEHSKDSELKVCAKTALNHIERRTQLCHLDFHFENIMFDGCQYFIIDWTNAKLGHPVMDIARTFLILKQYAKRMANKYLRTMLQKTKITLGDFIKALPLMAYLRWMELPNDPFQEELSQFIIQPETVIS